MDLNGFPAFITDTLLSGPILDQVSVWLSNLYCLYFLEYVLANAELQLLFKCVTNCCNLKSRSKIWGYFVLFPRFVFDFCSSKCWTWSFFYELAKEYTTSWENQNNCIWKRSINTLSEISMVYWVLSAELVYWVQFIRYWQRVF